MKLLLVLIAMGVIGVIGTVEHAQAQTTPLTIPKPDNFPELQASGFRITAESSTNKYIISSKPLQNNEPPYIGNIYFQKDTLIESNPIFSNVTARIDCQAYVNKVNTLLPTYSNYIPNLAVPDNITPQGIENIHAIGIDVSMLDSDRSTPCPLNLEATSEPLFTTKELRITLYDNATKKPYYFSPTENVTQAQPIPACNNNTINLSAQTLINNTKMCYGIDGDDMIIMTKKLLGFYGVTETITPPTNPIALDSDMVETVESYNEKKQREQEYLALGDWSLYIHYSL